MQEEQAHAWTAQQQAAIAGLEDALDVVVARAKAAQAVGLDTGVIATVHGRPRPGQQDLPVALNGSVFETQRGYATLLLLGWALGNACDTEWERHMAMVGFLRTAKVPTSEDLDSGTADPDRGPG